MEVTSKRSKPKKDLLAKRTLKSLLDKPDQDLATIITESRGHIGIDLKRVRSSGLLVAVDSNDLHDASVILKSKSDFSSESLNPPAVLTRPGIGAYVDYCNREQTAGIPQPPGHFLPRFRIVVSRRVALLYDGTTRTPENSVNKVVLVVLAT